MANNKHSDGSLQAKTKICISKTLFNRYRSREDILQERYNV